METATIPMNTNDYAGNPTGKVGTIDLDRSSCRLCGPAYAEVGSRFVWQKISVGSLVPSLL
jgi:hypothetical protein